MIKLLLVGVDDTPAALAGARLAVQLAATLHATVHAVAVHGVTVGPPRHGIDARRERHDIDARGARHDVNARGERQDVDAHGARQDVDARGARRDVAVRGAGPDGDTPRQDAHGHGTWHDGDARPASDVPVGVLEYVRRLGVEADVPVHTAQRVGVAAHQILAEARSVGADLIVVGRSGRSGPGQPYIGSQTREVLEFAEVPVIVVPPMS